MAITREKKVDILKRLQDEVVKAKTIVFLNFHKLPVAEANKLRSTLRESATKMFVTKKTLLQRALAEAGFKGEVPKLEGEVAVAYLPNGDDLLAPAKGVYEFEKKTNGQVKIVGGVFEGDYQDAVAMSALAQIPAREVLLGQFVNIINSPIAGLVMVLDGIAKKAEVQA